MVKRTWVQFLASTRQLKTVCIQFQGIPHPLTNANKINYKKIQFISQKSFSLLLFMLEWCVVVLV